VTSKASYDSIDQVLAARQPLRRWFELSIGDGSLFRADERTPANGECDSYN